MGADEQNNDAGYTEFEIPITTTKGQQAVLTGRIKKITPEIQGQLIDLLAEILADDFMKNPDGLGGGEHAVIAPGVKPPSISSGRKRSRTDTRTGDEGKAIRS